MKEFHLKRGINIDGKHWKQTDEPLLERYVQLVRAAGFDHVRLPLSGAALKEGGPSLWEKVRTACETTLRAGLIPIFDMHGYAGMNQEPLKHRDDYLKLWEELAAFLADMDQRVVFEMLNEPSGEYRFKLLNEIQTEAIARIRKTNPTRLLAAATAHFNVIDNLHFLELPENDPNIFVTVHEYTPMKFTHQGASWSTKYPEKGITWGTDEEYRYMKSRFDLAAAWGALNKRHIHLGEFGVLNTAAMEDRARWTAYVTRLCEERGFGWAYWEFNSGFGAYNNKTEDWNFPLLKALIPETPLTEKAVNN